MTSLQTITERVKELARELGFDLVGIAPVEASRHAAFYREWIAANRHGDMTYLARPDAVKRRLEPAAGLRSTNRIHHPARFKLRMTGVRCAKDA